MKMREEALINGHFAAEDEAPLSCVPLPSFIIRYFLNVVDGPLFSHSLTLSLILCSSPDLQRGSPVSSTLTRPCILSDTLER